MRKWKKFWALLLTACLGTGLLAGCGAGEESPEEDTGKKTFVLGDTTFNPENEEPDVNPHNTYSGWACIRYGI